MTNKTQNLIKILPFNFIVFGGDGDLAYRKIYPALFHRFADNQLQMEFNICCITRTSNIESDIMASIKTFIEASIDYEIEKNMSEEFLKKIKIIIISKPTIEEYRSLQEFINNTSERQNVYYLSTPSSAFGEISSMLKKVKILNKNSKVVLEKPLGFSLKSYTNYQIF
jgi:glucose-6-phosphate 1-dehydrogenase